MASFGFSIGDIILLSQLSYKLYQTVTSGRRKASRELKELADVLFGLRCALSHLHHVANDISIAAASNGAADAHEREMQQALDQMIENCASTLEDLDAVTVKYREGASRADEDANSAQAGTEQSRRKRLKRRVAADWAKIRWDMGKDDLKSYREKLQAHADSINLVLNTFVWSTTKKIQADGKVHGEKIEQYFQNIATSNSSLELLVQGIHSMLVSRKENPVASLAADADSSSVQFGEVQMESALRAEGADSTNMTSAAAYYAPLAMVNMLSTSRDTSIPLRPRGTVFTQTPNPSTRSLSTVKSGPQSSGGLPTLTPKELPPKIVLLNLKRQSEGLKSWESYRRRLESKPRPAFLQPKVSTVGELEEGLEHIFSPLPRSTALQLEAATKIRRREIELWIRSFSDVLDAMTKSSALITGDGTGPPASDQPSYLINLLAKLNGAIETSSANTRIIFYEGAASAQLDHALKEFVNFTKSVRAQKEIDEFTDERDDWGKEY